jgi:hypothetical protein
MKSFVLLTILAFASKNENDFESVAENSREKIVENAENSLFVKIEEDEHVKKRIFSNYFGVSYYQKTSKWRVRRWCTKEKKIFNNGYHEDEETAAHASDTLARKLMAKGEENHKLNFPDENIKVHPDERAKSSSYIGVYYNKKKKTWKTLRWSKILHKDVHNGSYKNEETAGHASDTLARKLMFNGEQSHKLNFPESNTKLSL